MTIVNLMPHSVVLYTAEGVKTFPPSGSLARVRGEAVTIAQALGVEVIADHFSPVVGLPDPQPNTIYLVSGRVIYALSVAGDVRSDVLSPATSPKDGAIRDPNGRVVGVTRLRGVSRMAPIKGGHD